MDTLQPVRIEYSHRPWYNIKSTTSSSEEWNQSQIYDSAIIEKSCTEKSILSVSSLQASNFNIKLL